MRNFSDGSLLFGPEVTAVFRNALEGGSSIHSGCTPSAGTNALDVDVASGSAAVNGSVYSVSATTVSLAARDTYDRYDLITIGSSGSVNSYTGSTELKCPDLPTGEALVSVVKVPSSGAITVHDSRVLTSSPYFDTLIARTLSVNGQADVDTVVAFDELDIPVVTSDQSTAGRIWYRSDLD